MLCMYYVIDIDQIMCKKTYYKKTENIKVKSKLFMGSNAMYNMRNLKKKKIKSVLHENRSLL